MANFFRKLFPKLSFRRRYLGGQDIWGVDPSPERLMDLLEELPPGRALDLGCGKGYNTITMAEHGWETTGVDFVPEVIEACKEKAAAKNLAIDFRVGDVTRSGEIQGPFDLIIDIGCYHSLSPKKRGDYRKNLVNLLASGGTYLLYGTYNPIDRQPPGLTEDDIDDLLTILTLVRKELVINKRRRPAYWVSFTK